MAAKMASCFTFLKEALILPTRNPKLFRPVLLLLAITTFLTSSVHVLLVRPFTNSIVSLLIYIKNTSPPGSEYAKAELLEMIKKDAVMVIPELVIVLALGYVIQILAFFAASTTYSGDRHSLGELVREISKGTALKGPSITIAVVIALEFAWMAVLVALLSAMTCGRGVLPVQGLVFVISFITFLYFTVVALVSVAASVADEECHGVHALRRALWLMTQVRRKEGLVLVLMARLILPTVVAPLFGIALVYAKKSMVVCLCMLAVYAFLSGAQQLFYVAAATVYYYESMKSKEASHCDCAKNPSREPTV